MKCPNCFFPMKYEYDGNIVEYYGCPMCGIIYNKSSHSWYIPDKFERITDKQQNAIDFINSMLNLNLSPVLKSEATFMIKKYINKASKIAENKYNNSLDDMEYDVFSPFGGFYNEFCNG